MQRYALKVMPFANPGQLPDNTPYKGAHVEKRYNDTMKLYIDDRLIIYCPYGIWYWESPAYKPEHTHIVKWFMQTYFPNTRLRRSPLTTQNGLLYIEQVKNRQEIIAL